MNNWRLPLLVGHSARRNFAWAVLVFVLFFLLPEGVAAQWTTNSDNINNTNTGNVGIGTTAPAKKLVIQSDTANNHISIVRPTTNAAIFNFGIDNTGPFFESVTANKPISFYTHNGSSVAERMRIDKDGRVGIGITNPARPLHVKDYGGSYIGKFESTAANSYFEFVDATANSSNRGILGNYQGDFFFQKEGSAYGINFITGLTSRMKILNNGNVGIGTTSPTAKLHVEGDVTVAGNIAAKYQDIAEWVPAASMIPAGTVVVLDSTKSNEVIASTQAYDTRVAGVISAQPGLTLGEAGEGKVLVATTGRVRVKVDATAGPIQVGDLLVTSDKEGLAMKSLAVDLGSVKIHRPGTLIGKALEPLEKGIGEIMVLLSLQ